MLALLLSCTSAPGGKAQPASPAAETGTGGSSPADSGQRDSLGDTASGETGDGAKPQASEDPTDAVFDLEVIHTISLAMDAEDWLQVRDNPWTETWVSADFQWTSGRDGSVEEVAGIGVRAFGAGSMIAGKPALKFAFDHYKDGAEWRNLEQLKLDNSSQDAGYMNERIATAVLRGMDLPAARTGWARLVVNGEAAGFFVLLESVDDRFVERWFGDDDGPLYGMNSGYWGQGLNPMEDPLTWYEPQTSVGGDGTELVEAAQALATGSDEDVAERIDLDQFTRLSVTRSVLGGIDTFSADGNNFYLYVDDGVLKQIAWDLDADLGYPWYFSTALSVPLDAPWTASPWAYNAVSYAPYEDPVLLRHLAMGADLDAIVDELLAGPLDWETTDAAIVASAALIRDDVQADVLGLGSGFDQRIADLRLWLHARLSGLVGADVADCEAPDDGSVSLGALEPSGTVGWGELLIDQTPWGPGFSVAGEHHCTGLFAHAPSRVVVTLPEGSSVLRGAVGLQDWNQACGDGATFEISQGGTTLWASAVLETYDEAVDLGEIAVDAGELVLSTAPNAGYACDTTAWLDLRVR